MLRGKNAIVTGASGGIGRAVTEEFARCGANVWACCRKPDTEFEAWLAGLSSEYGVSITPCFFTLGDEESMSRGLQEIFDTRQPINILVNNAGTTAVGTVLETSMKTLRRTFEINYFSQIFICQKVFRKMMRNRSGAIVNISSAQAISPQNGRLAYASSKAALSLATQLMAREFAPFGIRVNAVAPGAVKTALLDNYPEKGLENYIAASLLKRPAVAGEIASVVRFLASDDSSFMTGQIVPVDGGRF